MKMVLTALVKVGRVVTSFWFVFVLLLAIAASLIWRGFSPGPSKLEKLAGEIRDTKFQTWYATIRTKREKAAVRTALDAYSRTYGSAVWARYAAEEVDEAGKPRYFDLAELALSIENGEDRIAFAEAHKDAYSIIAGTGSTELASAYAKRLTELREKGGRDWRVARTSPLAVAVHAATDGNQGLWNWYLDNRDWIDDYLGALHADPDDEAAGGGLLAVLREFQRRPRVYRALRDEVAEWSDGKDETESADLEAGEFLVAAMGAVSLYGETFDVLCDAEIPFGEALDVLANNIGDLDFSTPDACRETGAELANLHRSHRAIWDAAAAPGGVGAIQYFRDVPQHAEAILASFGDAGVLPFLMENYADSRELLATASEVLVRYEAVGWAVLANFAGNDELKRALLKKGVGHLVVPYVALKGGDSSAVAQSVSNPGWVKRYLNPDGSFKPETETIIETMPFVGGIATVMKHQLRGEPVTMGEICWAAFDVVDDAVTVAALIGSGGAATPAVAAKQAAKESAKSTAKVTIKQGSKQLAKQSAKPGGKYVAEKSGKIIVRNGIEKIAGRESKVLARRSLMGRVIHRTVRTASWTMRMGERSIRVVASPLTKTVSTWRKLPPATRKAILRTAAATMLFVAVTARTLPKLPEALHETAKRTGELVGRIVNEAVKGAADGFVEAVKASLGLPPSSTRPMNLILGGVALIVALLLLSRHSRRASHPPMRLA